MDAGACRRLCTILPPGRECAAASCCWVIGGLALLSLMLHLHNASCCWLIGGLALLSFMHRLHITSCCWAIGGLPLLSFIPDLHIPSWLKSHTFCKNGSMHGGVQSALLYLLAQPCSNGCKLLLSLLALESLSSP